MFFRFLLAFLTIFLLELYLLIKLGGIISALNVIGLIILTAIIGIVVAKEQWVRFARDIENHTIDDKEGADRILKYFCITIGAISLIIPGILSDLLG
ncbi:MAG: FxsA family protein, partial [Nitrospinota bacterium]